MSDLNLFNHEESPFDSTRQVRPDGSEFWSARDLQSLLGYSEWRNLLVPIERAMKSAANQGYDLSGHFAQSHKTPDGGGPATLDYLLSRFAAYLVAMNGDPNKPEVAAAQAYFAIRTREAEVAPPAPALTGPALMAAALVEAQATLEARDAQIAVMAPKADYVDTYVTDEDVMSFSTIASTLGLQESRLREILIERDWIYKETASRWSHKEQRKKPVNRYTEKAHKKSYFQRVENHEAPRFRGEVMHTLKITAEGAQAISRMVPRWMKENAA